MSLPRNDLKISVKGEAVPISFGFGGWVAFKKTLDGKNTMLMSDTVLLQEEVNPLISAAQGAGLRESPPYTTTSFTRNPVFFICTYRDGVGSRSGE